jgi:hypothetical protein
MSEASFPEFQRERESEGSHKATDQPAEFDIYYYGWCVVIAACLGFDGRIRLALRLHLLRFCKAACRPIRVEP